VTLLKIDRRLSCICFALLTPAVLTAESPDRFLRPGLAVTEIRIASPQPAGRPILITLIATNETDKPISLGAEPYLGVNWVEVRITDARGMVREAVLENGGGRPWSAGRLRLLPPGQSEQVPALAPPQQAGTYTLRIGDKKAQVTVKYDEQLIRARDAELLERLRHREDLFALHVFQRYPYQALTGALLKDLLSEDSQTAAGALQNLCSLRRLPKDASVVVRKAIEKQLELVEQQAAKNCGISVSLFYLAAKIGTDDALSLLLRVAHAKVAIETRADAMDALGSFQQAEAVRELRDALKDPNERVRFYAARALAQRKDPTPIPVLVEIARDKQSQWRSHAVEALNNYPNDPDAIAVLKENNRAVGRPSFASWWGGFIGPEWLLQDPLVREELKLTKEQSKKVTEIVEQTRSDLRDRMRKIGPGAGLAVASALHEKLHEERQMALARVLTPEQVDRLWQVNLQRFRIDVLLIPEVQKGIKLSADQEQKILAIMHNTDQERVEINETTGAYPEECRMKMATLEKASAEKIMAVLTEVQKKALRELAGKPFDLNADAQNVGKGDGVNK